MRPKRARSIDPIVLERRLGPSGVTEVWRARLDGIGPCAVKFPARRWSGHRGAARLIEREWAYLGRSVHGGVVERIALVSLRTGPGLVTEYLPGGDLVALAGSPARHWAGPVLDIARALASMHERGIVHRDVKPRNVVLDAAGRGKLVDFGLAIDSGRASRAGGGTPAYQSAAQRRGRAATPADDVHALAVTLYELLCGRLPYGAASDAAALGTPPEPPRNLCPACAEQPSVAELGRLVEALLWQVPTEPVLPLGALEALLGAIIDPCE